MHKNFRFHKNDDGIRQMAIFVAQLEKECVVYRVDDHTDYFLIEITGY